MSTQATALKQADQQTGADPASLFSPYQLGDLALSNRFVMSPMTRSRARPRWPGGLPFP